MTSEAVAGLGDRRENRNWGFYPFGVRLCPPGCSLHPTPPSHKSLEPKD